MVAFIRFRGGLFGGGRGVGRPPWKIGCLPQEKSGAEEKRAGIFLTFYFDFEE